MIAMCNFSYWPVKWRSASDPALVGVDEAVMMTAVFRPR